MYRRQAQSIVFHRVTSQARLRPAFTLIELVVSIGILVLMIAVAGTVFSLTLESTGQAKAMMTVSERLRALERTLREDLACVRRGGSQMVIEAHEVDAYWTADQQAVDTDPLTGPFPRGGDPERMIVDFDEASAADMIQPQPPRADVLMFFTARTGTSFIAPSVQSSLQLVTYGHAELGEMNAAGAWRTGPVTFDNYYVGGAGGVFPTPAASWHLFRRPVMVVNRSAAGYANDTDVQELRNGQTDVLYLPDAEGPCDYVQIPVDTGEDFLEKVKASVRRSQLDPTPPSGFASRLGAYFLPNCASFKVEFTFFDPVLQGTPGTLWVDPLHYDDAIREVRVLQELYGDVDYPEAWDQLAGNIGELCIDAASNPVIWAPDCAGGGGEDALYPTALRITVDVFDEAGRFERPVRHVMVIPVGS